MSLSRENQQLITGERRQAVGRGCEGSGVEPSFAYLLGRKKTELKKRSSVNLGDETQKAKVGTRRDPHSKEKESFFRLGASEDNEE